MYNKSPQYNFKIPVIIIIPILLIILLSQTNNSSACGNNGKKGNNNPLEILSTKVDKNEIIIEVPVDLNGKYYTLPSKSILKFKDEGILMNGTVYGDSTIIVHDNSPIFDSILIEGSWIIKDISTDLFKTVDNATLHNLSVLSSDKMYNTLYINHDCYTDVKQWDSYFKIKSSTTVIFNADIYMNPTKFQGGYCMQTVGNDIKIKGNGHYLFGSLANPSQETCWEWLHGLKISKECDNIEVNCLNSWFFPGDGFSIQGSDVHLENLNAKFNGRQGMSITQGKNIIVENSEFTYTAFYRLASGKGPGAGIDIEPNKGNHVDNILIKNCKILNNYKYIKGHINDLEIYQTSNAKIEIENCELNGIYLGDCSNVRFKNCEGICSLYEINDNIGAIDFVNSGTACIYK